MVQEFDKWEFLLALNMLVCPKHILNVDIYAQIYQCMCASPVQKAASGWHPCLWQGDWNEIILKVPSSLHHSVIP